MTNDLLREQNYLQACMSAFNFKHREFKWSLEFNWPHLIANSCKIASARLIIATLASRIF